MTDEEKERELMLEDLVAMVRNYHKTPQEWMKREARLLLHLLLKR